MFSLQSFPHAFQWRPCKSTSIPGFHDLYWIFEPLPLFPKNSPATPFSNLPSRQTLGRLRGCHCGKGFPDGRSLKFIVGSRFSAAHLRQPDRSCLTSNWLTCRTSTSSTTTTRFPTPMTLSGRLISRSERDKRTGRKTQGRRLQDCLLLP